MNLTKSEIKYAVLSVILMAICPLAVVLAGYGVGSLRAYFFFLIIPAFILFAVVLFRVRKIEGGGLFTRLLVGVVAGIALSIALDIVRLTGVNLGYLPADMPQIFGLQILGKMPMQAQPTPLSTFLGYLYHFMNGIAFAVIYIIVFGRTPWWAAVLYSVFFVEVGMMTLPPMAVMTGPFGLGMGQGILNGVFLTTLLAHVAMGLALGFIVQRWGRGGPIWRELTSARAG
jgi:hypothetical protein